MCLFFSFQEFDRFNVFGASVVALSGREDYNKERRKLFGVNGKLVGANLVKPVRAAIEGRRYPQRDASIRFCEVLEDFQIPPSRSPSRSPHRSPLDASIRPHRKHMCYV